MAGCTFVARLLPLARGRFCNNMSLPVRTATRALSCTLTCSQLQQVHGVSALTGKVDRFGGVTVNLAEVGLPGDISESSFSGLLQGLSP